MRKFTWACLSFLFFLLISQNTQAQQFILKKYVNPRYGIEVMYPEDWNIKEIAQPKVKQVFFSVENINHTGYYSTGIAINKFYGQKPNEDTIQIIKDILDKDKQHYKDSGQFISEKRNEIVTPNGSSIISQMSFKNDKGTQETMWTAVFPKDESMVAIYCEAPMTDTAKFNDLFRKIIMTSKLFEESSS